MTESSRIQQISDELEIRNILTLYCTSLDSKRYDGLDTVFTPDAFIDYTAAGGIKGAYPEVKAWLEKALALFPITQHIVTNFDIRIQGDEAVSRCVFYNPMVMGTGESEQQMFFVGGYYNDKLTRTPEGWRIAERIEESAWQYGMFPQPGSIPKQP
ncbi:MAG: nuclear transport factor 2 family protein [Dehalococcoidia bacterium]